MCDTITSMADRPAVPPLVQLLAQCRTEPLVADEVLAELCPELEQAILQRMAASQGRSTQSLNVGGWKSPEDFFSWPVPAVLLVPFNRVDPAHDRALLLGLNPHNLAGTAFVAPSQDNDPVALFDFCRHHNTSGASEMIFIWFLARNSRGTGPKMRVPTGSA